LQRRPIAALYQPTVIGKEGNKLFERMHGMVSSAADYLNTYSDSREQRWTELIAPVLRDMPSQAIVDKTGLSERALRNIRNKEATPNRKHQVSLAWAAVEFAQEQLQQGGAQIEPFSKTVIEHDMSRQRIGDDALAMLREYQQMKDAMDAEIRCVVCQQPIKSKDSRSPLLFF